MQKNWDLFGRGDCDVYDTRDVAGARDKKIRRRFCSSNDKQTIARQTMLHNHYSLNVGQDFGASWVHNCNRCYRRLNPQDVMSCHVGLFQHGPELGSGALARTVGKVEDYTRGGMS